MDKEKVINEFERWCDEMEDECPVICLHAIAMLKEQEVVRCKDCRYGQYCTDGETTYQCFKWNSGEFGMFHEQNWFCADGERQEGR